MSAFIVAPATIDAAVSAIYDHLTHRAWNQLRAGDYLFDTIKVRDKTDLQKLATALYELNHRAVDARYNEHNPREFYRFQYITGIEPAFGIKQIQCLLYQCSEGDVPETGLFRALEKIAGEMCFSIVSRSSAYERAPWGCDEESVNRGVVSLSDIMTGRA